MRSNFFVAALLSAALCVGVALCTIAIEPGRYCGELPSSPTDSGGMLIMITVSTSQWLTMSMYASSSFSYEMDPPFSFCTIEGDAVIVPGSNQLRVHQAPLTLTSGVKCYDYIGDDDTKFSHPGRWLTYGIIPNATYTKSATLNGFTFTPFGASKGSYIVSRQKCGIPATLVERTYCSVAPAPHAVMMTVKGGTLSMYVGDPLTGDVFAHEDQTRGSVFNGLHGDTFIYFPNPATALVPNKASTEVTIDARRLFGRVVTDAIIPKCPATLPASAETIIGGTHLDIPGMRIAWIRATDTFCYGSNVPTATSPFNTFLRSAPTPGSNAFVPGTTNLKLTMSMKYFVTVQQTLSSQCPVFSGKYCAVLPNNVSVAYSFDPVSKKYHKTAWTPPAVNTTNFSPFPEEACTDDVSYKLLLGTVMTGGSRISDTCVDAEDRRNVSLDRIVVTKDNRVLQNTTIRYVFPTPYRVTFNTTTLQLNPKTCVALPDGQYAGTAKSSTQATIEAGAIVYTDTSLVLDQQNFVLHLSNTTTGEMDCATQFFINAGTAYTFGGSVYIPKYDIPVHECNARIYSFMYDAKTKSIALNVSAKSQRGVEYSTFQITLKNVAAVLPVNTYCGYIPGMSRPKGPRRDIATSLKISAGQWFELSMFFTDQYFAWDYDGARRLCTTEGSAVLLTGGRVRFLTQNTAGSWCSGILYSISKELFLGGLPQPTYAARTGFTFAITNLNGSKYTASLDNRLCNSRVPDGIYCSNLNSKEAVARQQGIRVRSTNGFLTLYYGNVTTGDTFCFNSQTSGTVVTEITGDCSVFVPTPANFKAIAGGGIQFSGRRLHRTSTSRKVPPCAATLPSDAFVCNLMDLDKNLAEISPPPAAGVAGAQLVWLEKADTFCYSTTAVQPTSWPAVCNVGLYVNSFDAATKTYTIQVSERIYRDLTTSLYKCPVFTGDYCGVITKVPNPVSVAVTFDGAKYLRRAWRNSGSVTPFSGAAQCQEYSGYHVLTGAIMTTGTQITDECATIVGPTMGLMRLNATNPDFMTMIVGAGSASQDTIVLSKQACVSIPNGGYYGASADRKVVMFVNVFSFNNGQQATISLSNTAFGTFRCQTLLFLITPGTQPTFGGTKSTPDPCGLTVTRFQYNATTMQLLVEGSSTFGSGLFGTFSVTAV